MAAIIAAILWRAENPLALWTFLVLWWMHTSAKLNVFFGVRNLGEEFIPHHMRYILSYMSRRSMNAFFPLSVSVSTVVTMMLVRSAFDAQSDPLETAGYTMLATLMVLAVLEHWLLVTPFDANVLWKWGAKKADAEQQAVVAAMPVGEPARGPQTGPAMSRSGAASVPADLELKYYAAHFRDALDQLRHEKRYRVFANLEREAARFPTATWRSADKSRANRDVTIWCSNDYLGMSGHAATRAAAIEAIDRYGVGAGGTRNISGTHLPIIELERELADLHGKE
eukprot:gene34296-40138_t